MATTPTTGNDNIAGTDAGEAISALAGNDQVRAGGGNDTVRGDAGNDEIDGGAGTDAAVFSGNQSQYQITTSGGVTEVKDLRGQGSNTPDGIDKVVNVERLVFADGYRLLAPDQAPDAADDAASTNEDAAISVAVLGNDTDADGDALSIASLSDADAAKPGFQTALGATVSVVDGQVRYDPTGSAQFQALKAGQSLADSFSYTVSDGFGGQDSATVFVTVAGVNDAPAAANDAAQTNEDTAVSIAVLANDTDPDGDALSIAALSDADPATAGIQTALGATISIVDGQVRYDPTGAARLQALNAGESQNDSFTYTVSDGFSGTGTATVSVAVAGANDAPRAAPEAASTGEDAAIAIAVLANDTDPDGDALTIASLSDADPGRPGNQTQLGATVSVVDGQVRYDPTGSAQLQALNNGQRVVDFFTYTVSDGFGGRDTVGVPVSVAGANDQRPPVAAEDAASTNEDTAVSIAVLGNDTDPDRDALAIASLSDADPNAAGNQTALGATISVVGGQVRYDPTGSAVLQALKAGESRNDSFTYTASDGFGGTDTAGVSVAVSGAADLAPNFDGQSLRYQSFLAQAETSPPQVKSMLFEGDVTIGPGVEIHDPYDFGTGFSQIDVSANSIRYDAITSVGHSGDIYLRFSDKYGTIDPIQSVSLVTSAGVRNLDASAVTFDADNILVNLNGVSLQPGAQFSLDLLFA